MKWRVLLSLGLFFYNWYVLASLPGDINGDGRVDVADLERTHLIMEGTLPYESAADVNGDQTVTEIDLWLIQEAVMGRPVLQLVDQRVVGSAGGTLTHNGFSVSFAAGSTGVHPVALFLCESEVLDSDSQLNRVYMISGLSPDMAGCVVKYQNCDSDMGLAIGTYMQPLDGGEMRWQWLALPGAEFTRSGREVSRSFAAVETSDSAVVHSMKFAVVSSSVPPPPALPLSVSPGGGLVPLSTSGRRYAGYRYIGWLSDRFNVYTKHWGTVSYSDLEGLYNKLYAIYDKIEALGFPLSSEHAAKFPLDVYVDREMEEDGCFCTNPVRGKWVEVNAKLLSRADELNATLGHELMHYALESYHGGDSFAFASIEDSITTWFEAVANGKSNHLSANYVARPAAPMKSLFVPITRNWMGRRNWDAQERHGYGTSAFIDYHFDSDRDQIYKLAQRVRAGQGVKDALNGIFVEKHGEVYDLERKYMEFAREYLMSSSNCYSSTLSPELIFASDLSTAYQDMYKLITIKEATTNLFEEQSVELKVQDYGCGVVQFKVFKPHRILAPHTRLSVKAPKSCKCVDLLIYYRLTNNEYRSEIVTGVYEQDPAGEDRWGCSMVLPHDANYMLISALVTMGNNGKLSDYTEVHDVTLTYQFEGDYYMPMQEMFIRYIEHSSQRINYSTQIFSDAVLRIVDPGGSAGLEGFVVGRTASSHDDHSLNYSVNFGVSSISASRRSAGAFQMRVFTETRVPDLPGFVINLDPDKNIPYSVSGQTPIPAPDGSVEMKLMLYHVPVSMVGQLQPGGSAYRIQSITTSSANMKQSADGESGGVVLDIPAQITGYRCLLYVFAGVASQDSDLSTVFLVSIDPMRQGGVQ